MLLFNGQKTTLTYKDFYTLLNISDDKNKNKIEIVKTDTINPNIQTLKVRSDSINIKEILKSGKNTCKR